MKTDTLFSSASGVHNTPAEIMERVRATLEGIELDPASSAIANRTVKAERFFADPYAPEIDTFDPRCAGVNGLALVWHARTLWLNPPFSTEKRDASGAIVRNAKDQPIRQRVIGEWVKRWINAIEHSEVTHGAMILIPARTDTSWFRPFFTYPVHYCFVAGRLTFSDADNSAPFPTVIFYRGRDFERFYMLFEEVGECGKFAR